jgi:hypothetical protein
MAHNIARIDGTDQAWYADKPAWHGLGTVTPGARTARQVIKAVPAFQRPVILVPVAIRVGGRWVEDETMRATVRKGDTSPMGYVTPEYEKLTDEDALGVLEAVITLVGEQRAKAGFVTSGLLGAKGARGFASIDLTRVFGNDLKVKRDPSRQESFLYGDWTHDGTGAMHAGLWNNRVECQNMLNMANAYAAANGLLARIVHKGDVAGQVREAQKVLALAEVTAKAHVALMTELNGLPLVNGRNAADKKVGVLRGFTEYVIPDPTPNGDDTAVVGKRALANRAEARETMLDLYRNSKTLVGVPESPYRLYQAAVEYADHHRPLRIGADTTAEVAADRRFRSITEGPAAEIKDRALEWIRAEFMVPATV